MVRAAQRASAVCDMLCEFLEALVHQVLFARGLYCAASFEDRRLYDTFVHKNRHPGVIQYVNSAAYNLKVPQSKKKIHKIGFILIMGR